MTPRSRYEALDPVQRALVDLVVDLVAARLEQAPAVKADAPTDELFDQSALAALLNRSESTLEKWRVRGEGPAFIKAGRSVRYRRRDVDAWLTASTVSHTQAVPIRKRRR